MPKRTTKTVPVSQLLEEVNQFCSLENTEATQEEKRGACCILERVLVDTGNYKGYGQIIKEGQDSTVWDRKREWDRRYFG